MKHYNMIIIGGATTGSYLARKIAEKGHSVLVIDQKPYDDIGNKYDIFHIAKADFERFLLPYPEKGNDLAFEFTGGEQYSAFGHYPKANSDTIIGMHMSAYTKRMNNWAKDAGADFLYETTFDDFLFESGKISGIKCKHKDGTGKFSSDILVDCSGIPSVARCKLPDTYGIENFKIGPKDMFYVTLRYVRYLNEVDYLTKSRGWPFYKTWEAPQADPHGAILGVGASISFETGEKVFAEFEKNIELPEYELTHVEKGNTPYRRPPYSFVSDGFLVTGDSACLTKPHAGEGVTSSMVHMDIAIEVIDNLLKNKKPLSKENLWIINKRYYNGQGKNYASILATLVNAVSTSQKENEFFFKKDVIFSKKSFEAMAKGETISFSFKELIHIAFVLLGGIISGQVRIKTIRALLKGLKISGMIENHYANYPEKITDYETWVQTADMLWQKCGSMADNIN